MSHKLFDDYRFSIIKRVITIKAAYYAALLSIHLNNDKYKSHDK